MLYFLLHFVNLESERNVFLDILKFEEWKELLKEVTNTFGFAKSCLSSQSKIPYDNVHFPAEDLADCTLCGHRPVYYISER